MRYLQELLGHESSKTAGIYTHSTKKGWDKIKSPLDGLDIWPMELYLKTERSFDRLFHKVNPQCGVTFSLKTSPTGDIPENDKVKGAMRVFGLSFSVIQ